MITAQKFSLTLSIILILVIILGWTYLQNQQRQTALAEIQQRSILRVGMDASFPPFASLNEAGQVIGLDADIARAIGADLGVAVEFVNIGFDGLYDALKIGRVDMLLSGLPVDPLLTQDVAYSINYFNAGQVLVSRQPNLQHVEDLADQTIAVAWGSMADLEARELKKSLPNLNIMAQPDAATALQADIAIVDAITAMQFMSQQETDSLSIVAYLTEEWYAAAVKHEHRLLLTEINKTLTRLREEGHQPCYLAVPRVRPAYQGMLTLCYAR